ncbi:MAG TPA: alpha/beta hydrolase [Solirubrobacterales bacterium]
MDGPKTFVLVHGAWHAGWGWGAVANRLMAAGHQVHAPTMAGHGLGESRLGVRHQDGVDSLVDYVESRDLHDVVLVAHSWGGFMVTAATPRLASRIDRLVYWNAFVPLEGETMLGLNPGSVADLYAASAAASTDNSVELDWEVWRSGLIQTAPEDVARTIFDLLGTEPYSSFTEPVDLGDFYELRIPASFINGTEDLTMPEGEYHWLERHAPRLGSPRLLELPIDHEALFLQPAALADVILTAAE